MPLIRRTKSSANPMATMPSQALSISSNSSKGTFQQSGESTPPCGVPKLTFLFALEPRSSVLTTLFVT